MACVAALIQTDVLGCPAHITTTQHKQDDVTRKYWQYQDCGYSVQGTFWSQECYK